METILHYAYPVIGFASFLKRKPFLLYLANKQNCLSVLAK